MKRTTVALVAVMMMIAIVGLCAYYVGWQDGAEHDPSTTYQSPAVVIEVDELNKWITLADWNGETWCVRDDGYDVGELVIVTFNNNETDTIYDDLIVEVQRGNNLQVE